MEGDYMQTCDVLTGELVTSFQIENRRNRPLCLAADGVGLEILLQDQLASAKILPILCLQRQGRGAGKARFGHARSGDPAHNAPA